MKKNHKGFSLVELVIVIAILAILGIAIYGFFHTSSRAYSSTSKEVDLQYEAQLVTNQLDNLIIDSTKGVDYWYTKASGENVQIISDKSIDNLEEVIEKTFIISNENESKETEMYSIVWNKKTQKVMMAKGKETKDADGKVVQTFGEPALMAEYVQGFGVSLERVKSQRVVEFHFDFVNGDRNYDTNHNITLRNNVLVNNLPNKGEDVLRIRSVDIYHEKENWTNKRHLYKSGLEHKISLLAVVSGVEHTQNVTWMLLGDATDENTSLVTTGINTCELTLGENETCRDLVVQATADFKDKKDEDRSTASTFFEMESDIVAEKDSDDRLLRAGDYVLFADKLVEYNNPITWGFTKITAIHKAGNTADVTLDFARRLEDGKVVDSVWNSYMADPKDGDGDGYYDVTWWQDSDNEKFMVLDTSGLENGKCRISCGSNTNVLNDGVAYQVQIEARVYDNDGKLHKQIFGSNTPNPEDPLYLERMRVQFLEEDGSVFEDFKETSDGCMTSVSSYPFYLHSGDTRTFYIKVTGYKALPTMTLVKGEGKTIQTFSFDAKTGETTFNIKDVGDMKEQNMYEVKLGGVVIYQIYVNVNMN